MKPHILISPKVKNQVYTLPKDHDYFLADYGGTFICNFILCKCKSI